MEVRKVSLSEIQLCDELYPRQKVDHIHVLRLMDALKAGVTFPPLRCDQNLRLIDGRHRYEAYRRLNVTDVDICIDPVSDDAEFFVKAVEANITHGRPFSPYDLTCIALRLCEDFRYDPTIVAQLLHMPVERVEKWLKQRVAISPALYKVPLKASFMHYGDKTIPPEVEEANQRSRGLKWVQALDELRRQLMDDALRTSVINLLSEEAQLREFLEAFAKNLLSIVHQAKKKGGSKDASVARNRRREASRAKVTA